MYNHKNLTQGEALLYLSIKAFHIMAMVSWFAAMFYLPRLFVYHAENREKKEFISVIKIMEYKLYKYIGLPAFWATLFSGIAMLWMNPAIFSSGGWIHAKLTLVALLIAYFFHSGKLKRELEADTCQRSGKFYRFYNEAPTLLLIGIIILVIIKPF